MLRLIKEDDFYQYDRLLIILTSCHLALDKFEEPESIFLEEILEIANFFTS